MPFLQNTLAKAAFKKSLGKAHTSNEKDVGNESIPSSFTLSSKDIFGDAIDATPSVAVAAGVATDCTGANALDLELDNTSNGKAYFVVVPAAVGHPLKSIENPLTGVNYVTGDRVTRIIPQSFGDDYRPILAKDGTEITPFAIENWFLDAFAGIVTSEVDLSLGATGSLECYIYSGTMLKDSVTNLVVAGGNEGEFAVYTMDRQVGPLPQVYYNATTDSLHLLDETALKFYEGTNTYAVSFQAPTSLSSDVAFTLPTADGDDGHVLITDGSGQLSFGYGRIGLPEDGSYEDGLFTDLEKSTPIGTAVDRINEILKALAPPPANPLSAISYSTSAGASANLSFGTTNGVTGYTNVGTAAGTSALDINNTFPVSGTRKGVYAPTTISGVVAGGATAHAYAYPANAFGDANQGTLKLEVNGVVVHSVDLSTFGSGASVNGNGSGFNLIAATSVKFQDGTSLDLFKYRTGTWTISTADQSNGWNYMRVSHEIGTSTRTTNYFEWVNDADVTATSFSGASLHDLSLTGSKYISGVQYYTGGTAQYDVTIENAYRNTYSTSGTAISHPSPLNCSLASTALSPATDETDTVVISNKAVTISPAANNRILGGDLSVTTRVLRSVQAAVTSAPVTGGWKILLDNNSAAATNLVEDFKGEDFRQQSSLSLTSTAYTSGANGGPANWTSASALTDGLLIYNGALRYPKQGFANGDFRNVDDGNANGPTVPGGYASNPNYSSATGEKVYLRYFYTTTAKQNFSLNVTASSTTFVAASNRGSLSGNNVTLELLAPNLTTDGSGNVVWKDCVTPYTTDAAVGAYAATFGSSIPTNWGLTLGTKSTANSGYVIVLRVTAPAAWTGNISGMTLTLL